jgi:hypothetical protein
MGCGGATPTTPSMTRHGWLLSRSKRRPITAQHVAPLMLPSGKLTRTTTLSLRSLAKSMGCRFADLNRSRRRGASRLGVRVLAAASVHYLTNHPHPLVEDEPRQVRITDPRVLLPAKLGGEFVEALLCQGFRGRIIRGRDIMPLPYLPRFVDNHPVLGHRPFRPACCPPSIRDRSGQRDSHLLCRTWQSAWCLGPVGAAFAAPLPFATVATRLLNLGWQKGSRAVS